MAAIKNIPVVQSIIQGLIARLDPVVLEHFTDADVRYAGDLAIKMHHKFRHARIIIR
jgi:hypothetical protein